MAQGQLVEAEAAQSVQRSICREGWYFLVILGFLLAGALLRQINLLILLFGALFALLLVHFRQGKRSLQDVQARRRLPRTVRAGEPFTTHWTLNLDRKHGAAWSLVIRDTWHDDLGRGLKEQESLTFCECVSAGSNSVVPCEGSIRDRGQYRVGPAEVSTRFPLGLIRFRKTLPGVSTLVVLPRLGRLSPATLRQLRLGDEQVRRAQRQSGQSQGDFYALRQYRSGDSSRLIHWRTSARRRTLLVRQYERPRQEDLAIVVDLYAPAQPSAGDFEQVETAVSVAATLLELACRGGERNLGLWIAGGNFDAMEGPASQGLLARGQQLLAVARAGESPDLAGALRLAQAAARSGAQLIVISTRERGAVVGAGDASSEAIHWCNVSQADELARWYSAV